jgi:site-specific DNA-methyltransferase (adenine-specific)
MTNIRLHVGDCLEVLKGYPDNSFDSVVTDPPYHLTTGKKGGSGPASVNLDSPYGRARITTGFMGKVWDGGDVAFRPETWVEILRVLKPGGYLAAFGGTRTYHRLACAIEDAGFEIRDTVNWLYGSGFPKSLDLSKAIDSHLGVSREVIGTKRGVGGENLNDIVNNKDVRSTDDEGGKGLGAYGVGAKQVGVDVPITSPGSEEAKQYAGWGTSLKPSHEPICIARKPLIGTYAENVLAHGTGGINVDGCRVPLAGDTYQINRFTDGAKPFGGGAGHEYTSEATQQGRWPANTVITPDEEVLAAMPDPTIVRYFNQFPYSEDDAQSFFYYAKASRKEREAGLESRTGAEAVEREEGTDGLKSPRAGAGRTASTVKNFHPTVKPIALMAWMCRLITPPGGTVLDPFMGSGSTGAAAVSEGFGFVGVDLDEEYVNIARHRIAHRIKG